MNDIINRKEFLATIAAATVAVPLVSRSAVMPSGTYTMANREEAGEGNTPLRMFSKPLDKYDFDFMCEVLERSGIGGFELTVRSMGKVDPEKVEEGLPLLVERAKKHGLVIDSMVTGITSASDPLTERILETASSLGIKYYRMGYFSYDSKTGILDSLNEYREEMKRLAELNEKYNICGTYQNHSGTRVGGAVWDIYGILKDLPAEYIGCQYDVRHAMVEGFNAWITGMKLLGSRIRTQAVKSFTWKIENRGARAISVPMAEGLVNWDAYFTIIRDMNITGPMSLHFEYPLLDKEDESLSLAQRQDIIVARIKKDVDFINEYRSKYGLV